MVLGTTLSNILDPTTYESWVRSEVDGRKIYTPEFICFYIFNESEIRMLISLSMTMCLYQKRRWTLTRSGSREWQVPLDLRSLIVPFGGPSTLRRVSFRNWDGLLRVWYWGDISCTGLTLDQGVPLFRNYQDRQYDSLPTWTYFSKELPVDPKGVGREKGWRRWDRGVDRRH